MDPLGEPLQYLRALGLVPCHEEEVMGSFGNLNVGALVFTQVLRKSVLDNTHPVQSVLGAPRYHDGSLCASGHPKTGCFAGRDKSHFQTFHGRIRP